MLRKVRSLLNDEVYEVHMEKNPIPFTTNHVVHGGLVPWRGYWYWSGQQFIFGEFYNRREGLEIMSSFDLLVSGLEKGGVGLSDDESDVVREFVFLPAISPGFIHHMVGKYGNASINSAFLLDETNEALWMGYLLRKYKGHFYRKRYPLYAVV